jgi:hypothetical protein
MAIFPDNREGNYTLYPFSFWTPEWENANISKHLANCSFAPWCAIDWISCKVSQSWRSWLSYQRIGVATASRLPFHSEPLNEKTLAFQNIWQTWLFCSMVRHWLNILQGITILTIMAILPENRGGNSISSPFSFWTPEWENASISKHLANLALCSMVRKSLYILQDITILTLMAILPENRDGN